MDGRDPLGRRFVHPAETRFKFKGRTLGHEIIHLVMYRFFGNGIPLWLNEGYAEDASSRFYASFMRVQKL